MTARYNKIPRSLWQRPELVALDPCLYAEAALFVYLLTADRPGCVAGLLHVGPGGISDATGWTAAEVERGLESLQSRGLIVWSRRPAHVWVPFALECDSPESPTQATGWKNSLREMVASPPVVAAWTALFPDDAYPLDTLPGGVSGGVSRGVCDTPPRLPRSQEQEQEQEQENTPPAPQRGRTRKPRAKQGSTSKAKTEGALREEEQLVWAAYLAHKPGSAKTPNAERRRQIQAASKLFPVEDIVLLIEWASKAPGFQYQRDHGHDRFAGLMGKRRMADRIEAAREWHAAGRPVVLVASDGALSVESSNPDDYETPPRGDYVQLRGSNVFRRPDGSWKPTWKQLCNPKLPWRSLIESAARRRLDVPGADKYAPEEYIAALEGCPFKAIPGVGDRQTAIDECVNDLREARGEL